MVKLVDRYIGRAALMGLLAVWLAMTVLFVMFNLLAELRSAQSDYGTGDVFWFIALTTPRMAYQIFRYLHCLVLWWVWAAWPQAMSLWHFEPRAYRDYDWRWPRWRERCWSRCRS